MIQKIALLATILILSSNAQARAQKGGVFFSFIEIETTETSDETDQQQINYVMVLDKTIFDGEGPNNDNQSE